MSIHQNVSRLIRLALCTVFTCALAQTNDLVLAQRALGDHLWQVAQTHALHAFHTSTTGVEKLRAQRIVLEALAHQKKFEAILSFLKEDPLHDDWTHYFHAWALLACNQNEQARALLGNLSSSSSPELVLRVKRLQATYAVRAGRLNEATQLFTELDTRALSNVTTRAENALAWAYALAEAGKNQEARRVLAQTHACTARTPVQNECLLLDAELAQRLHLTSEAEKGLTTLVAQGTNLSARLFVPAACGLSEIHWLRHQTNDALRVAQEACARAVGAEAICRAQGLFALQRLANLATRTNACAEIAQLVKQFPDEPLAERTLQQLAQSLLRLGESQKALEAYATLLQVFPGHELDTGVLESRAWAHSQLKQNAEAVGLFARAAQTTTNEARRVRCLLKLGEILVEDNHTQEALLVYNTLTNSCVREEALFRRATVLTRTPQKEQAVQAFRALIVAKGPFAQEAALRMSALEAQMGHLEKAIDGYRTLLEQAEANKLTDALRVRALIGRGRTLYRAYRFREASADFEAVGRLEKARTQEMNFWRALCLYGDGADEKAATHVRQLIAHTTDGALHCDMLFWLGKYEASVHAWEKAIALFTSCAHSRACTPERRIEVWVRAARAAMALSDCTRVISFAKNVLEEPLAKQAFGQMQTEFPFVSEALILQGEAYQDLARFDEAELVFERALHVKTSPLMQRRVALARADCLFARGATNPKLYREALRAYREFLKGDEAMSPSMRLVVSFKIALSLEKLMCLEEAMDNYYSTVILRYWDALQKSSTAQPTRVWFDHTAQRCFAQAAFKVSDYYLARGEEQAAQRILNYVVAARTGDAKEAARRLARIKTTGDLQ